MWVRRTTNRKDGAKRATVCPLSKRYSSSTTDPDAGSPPVGCRKAQRSRFLARKPLPKTSPGSWPRAHCVFRRTSATLMRKKSSGRPRQKRGNSRRSSTACRFSSSTRTAGGRSVTNGFATHLRRVWKCSAVTAEFLHGFRMPVSWHSSALHSPSANGLAMSAEVGFNLLDEPWIVVLEPDGRERQVSILGAFEQAQQLGTIAGEVPTQAFAITRLLLAFLHRAIDGPQGQDEWEQLWEADELPLEQIREYAQRVRSRFDLFHPDTPFFQVADLRTEKDEVSGLEKIVADVPNGEPYFTTRSAASLRCIEAAEAARWLVHVHAFDPSGIKSGAVGDPRVKRGTGYPIGPGWSGQIGGVLPQGRNLRETLLLNLISYDVESYVRIGERDDVPPWERDPDGPEGRERSPRGAIDLYTWQT